MTVVRKHAKADDAPHIIQAARVTEDEVEAAKKEWEGLVLLEEEDWYTASYLVYPNTQ